VREVCRVCGRCAGCAGGVQGVREVCCVCGRCAGCAGGVQGVRTAFSFRWLQFRATVRCRGVGGEASFERTRRNWEAVYLKDQDADVRLGGLVAGPPHQRHLTGQLSLGPVTVPTLGPSSMTLSDSPPCMRWRQHVAPKRRQHCSHSQDARPRE
jgi:hypothetical protein